MGLLPAAGGFLDVTYGNGSFWSTFRPGKLTTNDLYKPADHSWDYREPLPTDSFDVVVFDPDYMLMGTPGTFRMEDDYGLDKAKSPSERMRDIELGLLHSADVTCGKGILLVKCQDQISLSKFHDQVSMVDQALQHIHPGTWVPLGRMGVIHTVVPQGNRAQRTPRNNVSWLLIYQRRATDRDPAWGVPYAEVLGARDALPPMRELIEANRLKGSR